MILTIVAHGPSQSEGHNCLNSIIVAHSERKSEGHNCGEEDTASCLQFAIN